MKSVAMLSFLQILLICLFYLRVKAYSASGLAGGRSAHSSDTSRDDDLTDDECFEPLQIACEINGYIIPAIVDTGAQISVMSESCARRCRVSNMIDGRFTGKAVGVGSSDILGRINELPMQVGPVSFHNKIAILRESRVDLILGLDFLQRFKSEINLDERILKMKVRGRSIRISLLSNHNGPLKVSRDEYEYDEQDIVLEEESSSEDDSNYDDYKKFDYNHGREKQPSGHRTHTRQSQSELEERYPTERSSIKTKSTNKEKSKASYTKPNKYDDYSMDEESDDDMRRGLMGVSMEGV